MALTGGHFPLPAIDDAATLGAPLRQRAVALGTGDRDVAPLPHLGACSLALAGVEPLRRGAGAEGRRADVVGEVAPGLDLVELELAADALIDQWTPTSWSINGL